jgi:AraC-like DNA-binding protein
MNGKVYQVNFSVFRDIFNVDSLEDNFLVLDNVMEIIKNNEDINSNMYNFPVKMEGTLLILCTQGYLKIKVGLKNILLEKNQILIILTGQIFQILELSSDFKTIVIVLKNNFFNLQNHFVEAMALQQIILQKQYLTIPEKLVQEYIIICNLIKNKIKEDNIYQASIVQNYLGIIFYNACNVFLQKENEKANEVISHQEEIFENFIRELEVHYREQHEVIFYANKLSLTPKYLSKLIFRISGKSAVEWIKEYLILEAQALLKSTSKTVQQVSNELNFANQSHFGRFFKRHTGLSPREYQKL